MSFEANELMRSGYDYNPIIRFPLILLSLGIQSDYSGDRVF